MQVIGTRERNNGCATKLDYALSYILLTHRIRALDFVDDWISEGVGQEGGQGCRKILHRDISSSHLTDAENVDVSNICKQRNR